MYRASAGRRAGQQIAPGFDPLAGPPPVADPLADPPAGAEAAAGTPTAAEPESPTVPTPAAAPVHASPTVPAADASWLDSPATTPSSDKTHKANETTPAAATGRPPAMQPSQVRTGVPPLAPSPLQPAQSFTTPVKAPVEPPATTTASAPTPAPAPAAADAVPSPSSTPPEDPDVEAARLKKELADLEAEESRAVASCSALLSRPTLSASPDAQNALAAAESQRATLAARRNDMRIEHRGRMEELLRSQQNASRNERESRSEALHGDSRGKINALARQAEALEEELVVLRQRRDDAMDTATNPDGTRAPGLSTSDLVGRVNELFAEWRHDADGRLHSLMRSEVRNALHELALRHEQHQNDVRKTRSDAVRDFRGQRDEAFHAFRKQRREVRRHAADAFFGSLKARRARHVEETAAHAADVRRKHQREVDEMSAKARAEARTKIDRTGEMHREQLRDAWDALEANYHAKEAQQRDEAKHRAKMYRHDIDSTVRRNEMERAVWADKAPSVASATTSGMATATATAIRKRVTQLADAASVAAKGIKASQRLPGQLSQAIRDREQTLELMRTHLAAKGDNLAKSWEQLQSLLQQLDEKVLRTAERATAGHSDVAAAQQRIDIVRAAWEREERTALSKATLPTADTAHCDVVMDLGAHVRELYTAAQTARETRSDHGMRTTQLERELDDRHSSLAKATNQVMGKYEEIAAAMAAVEAKQRHLENEANDLRLAKAALDAEWAEFGKQAEKLKYSTRAAQHDMAGLRSAPFPHSAPKAHYNTSRAAEPTPRTHFASDYTATATSRVGRTMDFDTLLRLPDDSGTTQRDEPSSQPLTTPSPDTDGTTVS